MKSCTKCNKFEYIWKLVMDELLSCCALRMVSTDGSIGISSDLTPGEGNTKMVRRGAYK